MALSRRDLLKRIGIGAAGAALLPALPSVARAADPLPKRLIVFATANGTIPPSWTPGGSGASFTLSPILKPFQSLQKKMLVLSGIEMESSYHGPGSGHYAGAGHYLTGTEMLSGSFTMGGGGTAGWGGGISVDQHIANTIGKATRFHSLQLGVQTNTKTPRGRISYRGKDQAIPPELDPYKVFDRLFANLTNTQAAQRLRTQRKSVLDHVARELSRIKGRLSSADQKLFDAHLTSVREVEKTLDGSLVGASCERPNVGAKISITNRDNYPKIGKLHLDLLAMALACDMTRVASFQWSNATSGTKFTWLGHTQSHHEMSHKGDSDSATQKRLTDINTWYAEQIAYFCRKLDAIPEGNGTMLDNSIVVWGNTLAKGNTHSRRNIPYVLVGSGGGALRTGRYLKYSKIPHNDLLVSLCNAMGLPDKSFGNPKYCNGPLKNL